MKIEERWACPRCGNQRRVVWGQRTYHCFNCRFQTASTDWQPHRFTDSELGRLTLYRSAVQVGLYSDEVAACT